MRTTRAFQPRIITDPRTLNIGDTIQVSFPEEKGRIVTWTGTIGHRKHDGHFTLYNTHDGAVLFAIGPGLKHPKIVLLKRAQWLDNVTLF